MRTVAFFLGLAACAETQYSFVAQPLPTPNPSRGAALVDGRAVAVDGFTKHRWASYSEAETCFESRLEDLREEDVVPKRPFVLMGFKDQSQRLDTVAKIASSRVTIKTAGQEKLDTTERAMAFPHVDVEVCFASPGRVITESTSYAVLKVPYSADNESAGTSRSRDGIWRLSL